MGLEKRVAVVTGGGSGIGRAVCEALGQCGAQVAVLDRDLAPAERTARQVSGVAIAVDVAQSGAVEEAFDAVASQLGNCDVVVHAAGIDDPDMKAMVVDQVAHSQPIDVLRHASNDQWQELVSVNLTGAFFVLRAALARLVPLGRGSVVMIGSETGVHGLAGLATYGATKGGVHALVRSAAVESIVHGVRINGVAPGVIDTPMSRRSGGVFGRESMAVAPIGRIGTAAEIASVVAFLASDLASYVVGEIVNVDGGRMVS